MGKKAKAGLLACAIAAAGLGGAYVHGAQQYRDRFIDGISINGVDASGKTVDEVEALLKEKTESEYTLDLQFRKTEGFEFFYTKHFFSSYPVISQKAFQIPLPAGALKNNIPG